MSGLFGDRRLSSGVLDARGTAARKMAIDSFRNIADTTLGPSEADAARDRDVDAIVALLKKADQPVAVVEVAERLGWDSDRAAQALSYGGDRGLLTFVRTSPQTLVGLPAAQAA